MSNSREIPSVRLGLRWRWVAVGLLWSVVLRAHDAMSSGGVVQVTATRVELVVDMGAEAAWLLIGESLDRAPDIDHSMDRLKAEAGKIYLLSWRGKEIVPRETTLDRRDDGGVAFKFVFETPAGSGKLRFEALFLKRMAEGHLTTLTLVDAGDNVLAAEILSPRQMAMEFSWPPPADVKR